MPEQSMLPRILVVDHEPAMREFVRSGLTPDGYIVSETDRGMDALGAVRRRETDMIVMDLDLPDVDGLQVIKRIRYALSDIPIIVLSPSGDDTARTAALDLGADDSLTVPFGIDELLERIRTLRVFRSGLSGGPRPARGGDLILTDSPRGVLVKGRMVRLSPREYHLLRLFLTHPGKTLTHAFILNHVWGNEADVQYVRVYIRALRQKIERDPDHPAVILTLPGVGYKLDIAGA
jgi:two-component system, OmpR family, KDP operon response regulator KdpE